MPNEFEYFPLYPRELLAETSDMTCAEFGAYMRLVLKAWDERQVGTVPDDDSALARLALASGPLEWTALGPAVRNRFQPVKARRLSLTWLRQTYQRLREQKKARVDAARHAANVKYGKGLSAVRIRDACATHPNTNTNSKKQQHQEASETGPPAPIPDPVVVARLRGVGVSDRVADELALAFPPERVVEVIDSLKLKRADDPAGYVVSALRGNWTVPVAPASIAPAERRKREAEAAEAKRREAAELQRRVESQREQARRDVAGLPPAERERLKREVINALPVGDFNRHRWEGADPVELLTLRMAVWSRLKRANGHAIQAVSA